MWVVKVPRQMTRVCILLSCTSKLGNELYAKNIQLTDRKLLRTGGEGQRDQVCQEEGGGREPKSAKCISQKPSRSNWRNRVGH